jgi:outer membrane lipoprotein carrier protein
MASMLESRGVRPRARSAAPAIVLACLALLAPRLTDAQGGPSALDLATRIQAHYDGVRDFTADFELQQTSGLLTRAAVDRGRVDVKKPAKMRWTFSTGDRNQVVSDGVRTYSYFPKDKYVMVSPVPKGDQASTALMFLAGRGSLTRDFIASLPREQPDGEWHLILKPTAPQADFTTLTLQVDRQSLALRGLIVNDAQGGVQRFRFMNLRENRGVPDSQFIFKMPAGVEVR